MAILGDWPPNPDLPGSQTPDGINQQNKAIPVTPSYLTAAWANDTKLSILITVGTNGTRYYARRLKTFRIYYIPSSVLQYPQDLSLVEAAIGTVGPLVEIPNPQTGANVTYTDASHINVPGWYAATGINNWGDESPPCTPVANPIDLTAEQNLIPANSTSVSVTKATVPAQGCVAPYTDTIYTLTAVPSWSSSFIGFQVFLLNYYAGDGIYRQVLFIPGTPLVASVSGTLRLPTSAAGHTLTFYFLGMALSGNMYPDPISGASATIASGP